MLSNVLKDEASSDQIEREHQQQVKKSQTYSEIWNLLVNAASWNTEECYHEFVEMRERDGWVDSQILEFVTKEEIDNCLMDMKKWWLEASSQSSKPLALTLHCSNSEPYMLLTDLGSARLANVHINNRSQALKVVDEASQF
jgi:hypothetical protein